MEDEYMHHEYHEYQDEEREEEDQETLPQANQNLPSLKRAISMRL
jgi:hypothetical protein